jgi:hypothetical protein
MRIRGVKRTSDLAMQCPLLTDESGHCRATVGCPLSAMNGLVHRSKSALFNHFLGWAIATNVVRQSITFCAVNSVLFCAASKQRPSAEGRDQTDPRPASSWEGRGPSLLQYRTSKACAAIRRRSTVALKNRKLDRYCHSSRSGLRLGSADLRACNQPEH